MTHPGFLKKYGKTYIIYLDDPHIYLCENGKSYKNKEYLAETEYKGKCLAKADMRNVSGELAQDFLSASDWIANVLFK